MKEKEMYNHITTEDHGYSISDDSHEDFYFFCTLE
jgi:hypothetical protein